MTKKTGQTDNREHFYFNRKARDLYHLNDPVFLSLPHDKHEALKQAELQTAVINRQLKLLAGSGVKQILPAQFHGMKLLHELFHHVMSKFISLHSPKLTESALKALEGEVSQWHAKNYFKTFIDTFPPHDIYSSKKSAEEFLMPEKNIASVIEETYLIWLNNQNPALDQFSGLISDRELLDNQTYPHVIRVMQQAFQAVGPAGNQNESLAELLTLPIRHAPGSLLAQLRYIHLHWADILEDSPFWNMLGEAIDLIEDEDRYLFFEQLACQRHTDHGAWSEKEAHVPAYSSLADAPARYSHDSSWMPEVVMIAKSTYVWLDQLSKYYGKPVVRLQDIPDRELDLLSERGFTALWLIGLWERSHASQKIKQLQGNPEAKASAYALEDYEIAPEIGGYEGYLNLRHRAIQRGIRLASDMVPNHTGIDSKLVRTTPEWFLSTTEPPYPNYSYQGPNLSSDSRYGIYIEDGYWNRSDAAVTFKRVDYLTGDTRYIYHGNDGTNMPWNDTAQLNFLDPEVREGVIQQILHVARMFPVIRFDAAMVLAKMHIQRLWYPLSGHAAGVPSRGAFAMSMADFDAAIPEEFWREVVDRVKQEVPETLLLAEAFWMLEGYFVRTLGMHRVYNSAFMHMLKKEDNASYRTLIKNTLEFDAEILKRYVNFMNNPDEDTAIAQFGKGDKYFGVCMMMATIPGLPMYGHGQIEGFTEKYGMEYSRAYYDEQPDGYLVERHYREIFPLLKKRRLFADVRHFFLYDVFSPEGSVNENIFAYSNMNEGEKALVIYNNRFEAAEGWIRISSGYKHNGEIRQTLLSDALMLPHDTNAYVIFTDQSSGLEFIRSCSAVREQGVHITLNGYQYHVFLDFREVLPSKLKPYDRLCDNLEGRGTSSIETAALSLSLAPLHRLVIDNMHHEQLAGFMTEEPDTNEPLLFEQYLETLLTQLSMQFEEIMERPLLIPEQCSARGTARFQSARNCTGILAEQHGTARLFAALGYSGEDRSSYWYGVINLIILESLQQILDFNGLLQDNLIDDWLLSDPLSAIYKNCCPSTISGNDLVDLYSCLLAQKSCPETCMPENHLLNQIKQLFEKQDRHLLQFMQIQFMHHKAWFREHRFVILISWMCLRAILDEISGNLTDAGSADFDQWLVAIDHLDTRAFLSGYEMQAMLREGGQPV